MIDRLEASAAALRADLDRHLSMIESCLEALELDRPRRPRRAGPPRRFWTEEERQEVRRSYPDTPTAQIALRLQRPLTSVYQVAQKMGIRKTEAYRHSPACIAFARPGSGGERFRFPKGHVPANKGLRRPGYAPGRMRETQFKKGELAGAAQAKWVPVGTEVRDRDGYLKRKISDDRTKPSRFNWKFVHVLVWEEHNGPVPRGHVVTFKNGDKADSRIGNLELLTLRQNMARNSIVNLPKPLAEVVRIRARLVRQIHKRERAQA